MLGDLVDRFLERGKTGYLILAGLFVLGLAVLYFLDVWLLGSLVAFFADIFKGIFAGPNGSKDFSASSWYFHHPFATAWAWLVTPDRLSNSGIRTIWLFFNGAIAAFAIVTHIKNKYSPTENDCQDRDIEKLLFKKVKYNALQQIKNTPPDRFFLGLDDRRRPVTLPVDRLTEHIHILGGSGTGKTSFAVLPLCLQAIQRNMPVVAIDFKGDEQAVKLLAREAGVRGKKFYFFTLKPGLKSNTYNPLNFGDTHAKIERIMTALDINFEGEAKFYSYCQQAVFYPLVKYLDSRGISYGPGDIRLLLQNPILLEKLTGESVDQKQIKGLVAALTRYGDIDIINKLPTDIDLGNIIRQGDVCYFDLRSAIAPEISRALGKMVAMELQSLAAERSQQDTIAMIAIDEFQNMACSAFTNVISKVRSANYGLVLANQALGDLRDVSYGFLNTVITNTSTKIIFNVEDPGDAEYFSRRSGQVVVTSSSLSTRFNKLAGSEEAQEEITGQTVTEINKPLIHSNVLLGMPFGKSLIFRRGELAVLTNHSHLISINAKKEIEAGPWPTPVKVIPAPVKTVKQMIDAEKQKLAKGKSNGKAVVKNGPMQEEEIQL
ncbi:MAG: TraM recognition domain-containing protein [Firmicutes bacterium]|nr:TraM recognition domain-containing protein [Bacillota bacterium]